MTSQDRRAAEENHRLALDKLSKAQTDLERAWALVDLARAAIFYEASTAIYAALQKAREEERERCAKVAELHVPSSPSAAGEYAMRHNGQDIAASIRTLLESEGVRI